MSLRMLGAALVLALAFTVLTRGAGAPPAAPSAPPGSLTTEPRASDPEPPPPPSRDVFRYAEPVDEAPRLRRPLAGIAPAPPPSLPAEPVPPPLRLVGLIRQSQGLRAAVGTSAGVVVVGPGDVVDGYTVLGVDEDRGLRLRAPDGGEITLSPLP
jgi:hypothetical protein